MSPASQSAWVICGRSRSSPSHDVGSDASVRPRNSTPPVAAGADLWRWSSIVEQRVGAPLLSKLGTPEVPGQPEPYVDHEDGQPRSTFVMNASCVPPSSPSSASVVTSKSTDLVTPVRWAAPALLSATA